MSEPLRYRGLLRQPNFAQLWLGQSASLLGDSAARVAVPVLAVAITGSPAVLGVAFAVQALPWFLVSPFAGLLADSVDRRRVVRLALLAEAGVVAAMSVADTVWLLLVLVFAAGCLQVVQMPARAGALPAMLGRYLPLGAGLTAATIQVTDVAGQAVAGLALIEISARTILLIDAVTFVIFAFAVPPLPNATGAAAPTDSFLRRLTAGARTGWGTPALRRLVSAMIVRGATVTAALSLLYALVAERDLGPTGFGLVSAAFTAALVAGSLVTGRVVARRAPEPLLLITTALAALVLLPIGFDIPLWAATGVLVIAGVLYAPGNVIANAEIARLAPEPVRGQVVSAAWALIKVGQVVGGLLVAGLVGTLGAGRTIAVSAALLLVSTTLLWILSGRNSPDRPVATARRSH